MKKEILSVLLGCFAVSAEAQILLDCGRALNFKHEYSVHMKDDFSTTRGRWSFEHYGVRKNDATWQADVEYKGPMAFRYTIVAPQGPDSATVYMFQDFRGCYQDSDRPAALAIFQVTPEGRKFKKTTLCRCQMFD